MSESDLDSLYKRASAQEAAQPSAAARRAILEHARRLAEEARPEPASDAEHPARPRAPRHLERAAPARWSRWFARWPQMRWQLAVPLAAAALAVILLQPLLRSTLPSPTVLRESAPSAPSASHLARTPPAPIVLNMPVPANAPLPPAPEAFPATSQRPRSASSRGIPAAPPAPASSAPEAAAAPPASLAPSANVASSAEVARSQSAAPAARMQNAPPAAPLAELSERAQLESNSAGAARSQSDSLREAAAQGDVMRVRSLLQQSTAAIDARDARGRTALLLAVLHDHEAVARALLEHGADPNIGDVTGRTPLAVARRQHRPPLVETLLQAGAR